MEVPDETERKGYNPVSKSVYSVEKLKTLGWQPVTSIKDGIKRPSIICNQSHNHEKVYWTRIGQVLSEFCDVPFYPPIS